MTNLFIKPSNLVSAGISFAESVVSNRARIKGMPVSVSVELTNNCNLKCPECATGTEKLNRERGFMDLIFFKNIIEELKPYLYYINLYFQGEPMLHPDFFSFVESCEGIYSVVSTNGHFLSRDSSERLVKSGLRKLIVSVDGADKESYSAYRINGSLDKVVEGLENIHEVRKRYKSQMALEIQTIVNRRNENQIPEIGKLAKRVGANLKLKSMQIINMDKTALWIPDKEKYRRYLLSGDAYKIKSSMPNRCARLWFNPVITWDGKVVPCCFDKDAKYTMGSLVEKSFREIWNSSEYRAFRHSVLSNRRQIDICNNCTSGLNN